MTRIFLVCISMLIFATPVLAQPYELDIRSDRLDINNTSDHAVFEGSVVVVHQDLTLKADKVDVYYEQTDGGRSVREVKAYGNVSMEDGQRVATGKRAVYNPHKEHVTLFGNVKVTQDEGNTLYGTKMLYDMIAGRITLSSGQSRVRAKLGGEK